MLRDLLLVPSAELDSKKNNNKRKAGEAEKVGAVKCERFITSVSAASSSVFLYCVYWVNLNVGALWLADFTLRHPVEPCFLLTALAFSLMTALSACLSISHLHSLKPSCTGPFFIIYSSPLPLCCPMAGLLLSISHPQ